MKTVAVDELLREKKCRGWKHFINSYSEYHFGAAQRKLCSMLCRILFVKGKLSDKFKLVIRVEPCIEFLHPYEMIIFHRDVFVLI